MASAKNACRAWKTNPLACQWLSAKSRWDRLANSRGDPPFFGAGTGARGIHAVTKSLQSNGAMLRSECHLVGPSPGLL